MSERHKFISCIACGKNLRDIGDFQPLGGLAFVTHGHYGSTFFDPMDGSCIQIAVCDECLEKKSPRVLPNLED